MLIPPGFSFSAWQVIWPLMGGELFVFALTIRRALTETIRQIAMKVAKRIVLFFILVLGVAKF